MNLTNLKTYSLAFCLLPTSRIPLPPFEGKRLTPILCPCGTRGRSSASCLLKFAIHAWLLLVMGLTFCQQPSAIAKRLAFSESADELEVELVQPTESSNNGAEIIDYSEIIDNADLQSNDDNAIHDKIDKELDRTVDNIIDSIFDHLPDSIQGFLGGFEDTVSDFVSTKIPDIGKIVDIVFNSELSEGEADLPSRQQSETLEGTPDNYAISESETDAVVREVLVETVESTTLNESAQTNLKQTAVRVQKSVDESVDLGEDSQSRDVTHSGFQLDRLK